MKIKQLLIWVLVVASFSANAQFFVEFGASINVPRGDFGDLYELGIGGQVDAKYAVHPQIDLGVALGLYGFAGADDFDDPTAGTIETSALSMFTAQATGTYRLLDNENTPFIGTGVGLYSYTIDEVNVLGGFAEAQETTFGIAPEVGAYLGPFSISIAYNILPEPEINFYQFNLGYFLGSRD